MKQIVLRTMIAIWVLAVAVLPAAAQTSWQLTDAYSVKFDGGETSGIFKGLKGTLRFDDKQLASSVFDVTVDVGSINTGNGLMNKHAKSADWFDAAKYPQIHFKSDKIVKVGSAYQAVGILEMHGVKKPLTLPFSFQGSTFTASFTVNRSDFGIGKPGGEVSEKIKVDLSVPVKK